MKDNHAMNSLWTNLIITSWGVFLTAITATWISMRRKLFDVDSQIKILRERMNNQEKICADRLQWYHKIEDKINVLLANTERIRGMLDEMHRKGK